MRKLLVFLHTAPVHVATFDRLLAELAPETPAVHVVDESLLHDARIDGITPALQQRVAQAMMQAGDAALVLCTCSTIGGCAEDLAATLERPVLRVDRAMAERAVALGERILVAAALESTLAPTRALLLDAAQQVGKTIAIAELLCEGAWTLFEQGDQAGYIQAIAACLRATAGTADVVVLAQASMADAAALCADLPMPILSSPRLGLEPALREYAARSDQGIG